MQNIEPFYGWENYYHTHDDELSPFYGHYSNTETYENHVYGYYIHPFWDPIGSETLYIKILYADYKKHFAIIEMMGEWNDTLHNDIMYFKRNIIDVMLAAGLTRFILLGENVLNFHGIDDEYYAEWMEEIEDEGWICAINFRDFVQDEWRKFGLDYYFNFGGTLDITQWRTLMPEQFFDIVNKLVMRRISC